MIYYVICRVECQYYIFTNTYQFTFTDAFLDVHGDEVLPYNFLAGSGEYTHLFSHLLNNTFNIDNLIYDFSFDLHHKQEGCPNWSERLEILHGAFLSKYSTTNSDMQIPVAYEPEEKGQGRLNVCSNQIAFRYDCLSATLEMPFKDCLSNPDPERGWNGARAAMLGSSVIEALVHVGPYLREENLAEAFDQSKETYVKPTSDYKSLLN